MHRRSFIQAGIGSGSAALALPQPLLAGVFSAGAATPQVVEVTTEVDLAAAGPGVRLWLPVFASHAAGQKRLALNWESDAAVRLTREPRPGAEILEANWGESQGPRRLKLVERVATWDRSPADRSPTLSAAERALWSRPRGSAADRAIVRQQAERIVGAERSPAVRLRLIYDWAVQNTFRDPAVAGCGPGDAAAMLRSGRLGGKCADINGLTVCLVRALGMPAREIYGLRLVNARPLGGEPSPGSGPNGDVTASQHCRAEVWLDGIGWFAVDPADVRKAMLEGKVAGEAQVAALADKLFGSADGRWAAYNHAGEVHLDGATRPAQLRYLMYPAAMTPAKALDSLDPAHFAYRITAQQVAA